MATEVNSAQIEVIQPRRSLAILGRVALSTHNLFVTLQLDNDKEESPTSKARYGYQNELLFVRHELGSLSDRQKQRAAKTLFRMGLPLVLEHQFEQTGLPVAGLIDWIIEEPEQGSEPEIQHQSDSRLLNFLQWHENTIESKNSHPKVLKSIDCRKREYVSAVEDAVAKEWLDSSILDRIARIDEIDVSIGDVFHTLLDDTYAYHTVGTNRVVMAQGERGTIASDTKSTKEHLFHELNHALLPGFSTRWLNEASAEHLAVTLAGHTTVDKIELLGEAVPVLAWSCYSSERSLLSTLLKKGKKDIPAEFLLQAYTSKRNDPVRKELSHRIDKSWGGKQVLNRIAARVRRLEAQYNKEGLSSVHAKDKAAIVVDMQLWSRPDSLIK